MGVLPKLPLNTRPGITFTSPTPEFPESHEERVRKQAEAVSKIQSLYDAGAKLFSMDVLRDLHLQLKNAAGNTQAIIVPGIDGVPVAVELTKPGHTLNYYRCRCHGQESVAIKPYIFYKSIQFLADDEARLCTNRAYCSVEVNNMVICRHEAANVPDVGSPISTYAEVEKLFRTGLQEWETFKTCRELRSTLTLSQHPFQVKKIVGFACGSLDTERTLFQHAMLLTLSDIFGKKEGNSGAMTIPCFVQDPIYDEIERSVLGEAGITVLDDPEGFLEVDESTAVVSIAPNIPVRQIISDIARPALLIWQAIRGEERGERFTTDPESPRLREMIRSCYEEVEFPDDPENFGRLAIYVRRAGT